MDNTPNFEVVVGTYEEYLLGYKFTCTEKVISIKLFYGAVVL